MSAQRGTFVRVFAVPMVLALVTASGLLAALLLEPFGRYVAWAALGFPIAVVMWAYLRRHTSW